MGLPVLFLRGKRLAPMIGVDSWDAFLVKHPASRRSLPCGKVAHPVEPQSRIRCKVTECLAPCRAGDPPSERFGSDQQSNFMGNIVSSSMIHYQLCNSPIVSSSRTAWLLLSLLNIKLQRGPVTVKTSNAREHRRRRVRSRDKTWERILDIDYSLFRSIVNMSRQAAVRSS